MGIVGIGSPCNILIILLYRININMSEVSIIIISQGKFVLVSQSYLFLLVS